MALTAVRLRPVDRRKGWGMRTYTSANSRTKYLSGTDRDPSPFRLVRSDKEVAELQHFDQFEILEFDDMAHLKEFIQQEMEQRARVGLPAVRAAIMSGPGKGHAVEDVPRPRKAAASRLPEAAKGPVADPTRTNTGRQPSTEKEPVAEPDKKPEPKPEPKPKKAGKGKKKGRSTKPAKDE